MTDEQCARLKAQLERLRSLDKQLDALPESVAKVDFPDLRAELEAFQPIDEYDKTEANAELVIEETTKRIQWHERYLARCREYMEQQK